MSCYTISSCN